MRGNLLNGSKREATGLADWGASKMINVAINGYGRIGRNVLRALYERTELRGKLQIVAINDLGIGRGRVGQIGPCRNPDREHRFRQSLHRHRTGVRR